MNDDVIDEATQEITKAWRASLQIAEFAARARQRELARAQQASVEDERRIRHAIEGERRLAEPVYNAALDKRWWQQASPQQAAHVHGVATRFARIDTKAAQAVWECERQASSKWGIDLHQRGRRPLTSDDVDPQALEQTAPAIAGEQDRNWSADLDASAKDRQEVSPRSDQSAGISSLEAEQAQAVAWVKEHYNEQARSVNFIGTLDDPTRSHDARQWAHKLYAAVAAEGYDINHPPALDFLDGPTDTAAAWEASQGWKQDLADATGIDVSSSDLDVMTDHRSHIPMRKSWQAEQEGRFPDLGSWYWNGLCKGSDAVREVPEVRLVGESRARSGTYTELARTAAAREAQKAGMDPQTYLDFLLPHQRRAIIAQHGVPGGVYEPGLERMAAYRVAYAQQAARAWPDTAETNAAVRQSTAAHLATDKETAEANDALNTTSGVSTPTTRAEVGDEIRARSTEAAWDSHAARSRWAAQQIENGAPAEAVRAAVTGQLAMHEPVSKATLPHKGRPKKANPKAALSVPSRKRSQHR